MTAAFIYDGRVSDRGWTFRHDVARKALDEEFDWLQTKFSEEVAPSNFTQNAKSYINQGADIIFGTTFGFMDPMVEVAKDNPDISFENAVGIKMRENMGRYDAHFEEGRYFAGIAAGMVTETNKLGFIGGFPIAFALRDLNAFTLGARSVNADVTVIPRWMNTWADPPKSKQAVRALVDEDVDVIAEGMDTTAADQAASDADVWVSGIYSDLAGNKAGDEYLTSSIVNWEPIYREKVKEVRNDEFESEFVWGSMKDDVIQLDEWGPKVPSAAVSKADERKQAYLDGEFDIWDGSKFEGKERRLPVRRDGLVRGRNQGLGTVLIT
ncbi:MAG: BMP family ABC transporter substrate-binding protein [Haloferacaceae archaeon]